MATVVHRATLEIRRSVNTPDYPPEQWLVNPTLPDCDRQYWVVDGDVIREMDAAEKAVVDAAALGAAKGARISAIEAELIGLIEARYPSYRREKFQSLQSDALRTGLVNRAAYIGQLAAWSDAATVASIQAAGAALAAESIGAVDAVSLDTSWLASDPQITLQHALEVQD